MVYLQKTVMSIAQYLIIKKLAEKHEHICVVGDDAQSIYSFRGANIDNILKFQSTYKNAKIFKLERNYRSTQTIVNAANSLIDKNSEQIRKTIFSEKETGNLIRVSGVITDYEEAFVVSNKVAALHADENIDYKDIAILYRTNSQSRVMEESLRKQNIPYRIYGGLSFYQRKEIKDVIAYLRLVCNSNDEEALKRIINYPARGIGDTTVNKISECARLHEVSMWDVLSDMLRYNLPVNSGTANKLAQFRSMIDVFAQQVAVQDAYELADSIVKTTGMLADAMTDRTAENLSRIDNVQELLKAIHEYSEMKIKEEGAERVTLPEFLSEVSLLTDQDTDKDKDGNKVTLMTIHAAKGLEFRTVFIVGLEEELFPSPFAETARELEEERRLFYVAITRAEEQCFISYSKSRFKNGKTNFANPSRFLKDIDKQYLEQDEPSGYTPKPSFSGWDDDMEIERNRFRQTPFNRVEKPEVAPTTFHRNLTKLGKSSDNAVPIINSSLPVGSFVKHGIFGLGKVLSTNLVDGNEKAEIDFGEKGVKSLLLKFAKLEVLK